jgi:chitodextrinase
MLGLVLMAMPNVGLLPSSAGPWLRIAGLVLIVGYVGVLSVRMLVSDAALKRVALPPANPRVLALPSSAAVTSRPGWLGRSASGSLARSPAAVAAILPSGSSVASPDDPVQVSPARPVQVSPARPVQVSPALPPAGPGTGSPPGAGDAPRWLAALLLRLRDGDRVVVLPVIVAVALVAGFAVFGPRVSTNADTTPPMAPANLRVVAATAQQVDLTWNPVTDESGVKEYRIVRADSGRQRIAVANRFYDTMDVAAGATYVYSVLAVDGAGNSSLPSASVTVRTPEIDAVACASDTTAPTPPANLRATAITATSATIEWAPASDAGTCGIAGYALWRDGEETGITVAGTSVTDDGLEPNHSYVYTVVARDNANNDSARSTELAVGTLGRPVLSVNPCEMTAPRNLHGTSTTQTSVSLAWEPPATKCNLEEYLVYRGGTLVGQTAGLSLTVSDLMPATNYVFRVRARGVGVTSPSSDPYSVSTSSPPVLADTTPPSVPTGIVITDRNPSGVQVSWAPSTDAGGSGVKEYDVFLDGVPAGIAAATNDLLPPTSARSPHYVEIRARDVAGNVSAKARLNFSTAQAGNPRINALDAQIPLGQDITFDVDNVEASTPLLIKIDNVVVYSGDSGAGAVAIQIVVNPGGSTGIVGLQVHPGTHAVSVQAVACGCSNDSETAEFVVIP